MPYILVENLQRLMKRQTNVVLKCELFDIVYRFKYTRMPLRRWVFFHKVPVFRTVSWPLAVITAFENMQTSHPTPPYDPPCYCHTCHTQFEFRLFKQVVKTPVLLSPYLTTESTGPQQVFWQLFLKSQNSNRAQAWQQRATIVGI